MTATLQAPGGLTPGKSDGSLRFRIVRALSRRWSPLVALVASALVGMASTGCRTYRVESDPPGAMVIWTPGSGVAMYTPCDVTQGYHHGIIARSVAVSWNGQRSEWQPLDGRSVYRFVKPGTGSTPLAPVVRPSTAVPPAGPRVEGSAATKASVKENSASSEAASRVAAIAAEIEALKEALRGPGLDAETRRALEQELERLESERRTLTGEGAS